MKNVSFRVITLKNGEIREFFPFNNKKGLKKAMNYTRQHCKYFDGFTIDYKINDIINTVLCQNEIYFGKDCIVERIEVVK